MFSFDTVTEPVYVTGKVTRPRATSADGTVVIIQTWSGDEGTDFDYHGPDFQTGFSLRHDTTSGAKRVTVLLNVVQRDYRLSWMPDEPLALQQKVKADIVEVLAAWPGNPALGCEIEFMELMKEMPPPAVRGSRADVDMGPGVTPNTRSRNIDGAPPACSYTVVTRLDSWGREVPRTQATNSDGTVIIVETWSNDEGTRSAYEYSAPNIQATFRLDHDSSKGVKRFLVSLSAASDVSETDYVPVHLLPLQLRQRIKTDITDALVTWPGNATGDCPIDFHYV